MSYVLNEINEHIAFLTINRPDALNAMNPDVIDELKFELQSCIDNDSVGVIILTGSGENAFIAGADIKKMQTMDIQEALVFAKAWFWSHPIFSIETIFSNSLSILVISIDFESTDSYLSFNQLI